MNEGKPEHCLEPRDPNPWNLQRLFFEVSAAQSSVGRPNPDLPDALLCPLVTIHDPCTIHSTIHTKVDWSLVKSRLMKSSILSQQQKPTIPTKTGEMESSGEMEGSSDGGGGGGAPASRGSTPSYSGRPGEPMDTGTGGLSEEEILKREKDIFIDEIADLVRNVRKYNDPSLSSSVTWIDIQDVEKLAKNLVLVQNYLPNMLVIEEIISALLFENGPAVAELLITEMPEYLVTIVNFLISNQCQGARSRYRNLVIGHIVTLYPYFVRRIVEKFANSRGDSAFACRLAVDHLSDKQLLEFLEPRLTDKDSMINKHVLRSGGRQVLPLLIARLISMAEAVVSPSPDATSPSEMGEAPWCTRLSYCLVDLLNLALDPWREQDIITITKFVFRTSNKPSSIRMDSECEPMDTSIPEEIPDSMDSIVPDSDPETSQAAHRPVQQTGQVEPSPFGDAHECFVLASLISIPFFTQYPINQTGAVQPPDRAVDNWLDISRKRVLSGDQVNSIFGIHLIYVHACIMCSRIDDLVEYASENMKHPVDLAQRHAQVLKNAFTSRCMTEIEVAKRSVCQDMSKCLLGDPMALRTIYGLQVAGVYRDFHIDLREWLEKQLRTVRLPASNMLSEVIDGYAQSAAVTPGKGISQEFVEETFAGELFDARTIARRIYVCLYLCGYRETSQRYNSSLRNMKYNVSIFRKIPARYLLSVVEQQPQNFALIQHKILIRTTLIFPYLLPNPDSMKIMIENQNIASAEILEEERFGTDRPKRIERIREMKNIMTKLETINRSSIRDQLAALPVFLDLFMESLHPLTPQGYENALISIFNRYEQVDPVPLFEKAAAMWIREDTEIDVEDIIKIPSLIFRCDRRILSSPPHFHCFVRTLNYFNKAVRTEHKLKNLEMQQKVIDAQAAHKQPLFLIDLDRKEKELLNGAYLDTQHSVLIHALIEVSDSKRMNDDPTDFALLEKRQQIRRIACEYIHRTFLDYEGLIRIVLHQKFPLRQIRDLVEGVPALFAGNNQILEMLSLADKQRRFFAIVFAAEICRKYRVRESLETARIVCDIVHSLHKHGELPSSYKIWKHVAPALMLLATEFPSLADSINRLLTRVCTTARNRLAVRCGWLAGDPRHDEYQLIELITSFLDRNSLLERL